MPTAVTSFSVPLPSASVQALSAAQLARRAGCWLIVLLMALAAGSARLALAASVLRVLSVGWPALCSLTPPATLGWTSPLFVLPQESSLTPALGSCWAGAVFLPCLPGMNWISGPAGCSVGAPY